uniref:Disease resistance protein RPP13 n=1 Tax=Triticum urartu TaxID=4572 RepID=A0A8R7QQ98_TRIUA
MPVSATMGVMKPLLGKLATLAGDEYSKLKGVRKQASFLEKELSAMNAALEKMELMDELDPVAKDWRDRVREMSYDMDNCIDDFIRQFGGAPAKAGFIKETVRRLKTLGQRHRIADRMEELKVLALEANERRIRYKIDECNSSSSFVAIDPCMSAIYVDAAGLVGTDGPRKELVNLLTDTEKKLKVVSIVGFGGLGKTTLAKQVYDEIKGRFNCMAFLPISQKPNMTWILNRLQLKLGMHGSSSACELQDLIEDLRKHLTNNRYLIVVDDLWDQSVWNAISRAFPENDKGSRVIVTTRVEDVASGACCSHPGSIYRMNFLDEQDSKRLFYNRIYGSEDDCPSRFEDISAEILKKCGGLPLAIITISSLLASRPEMDEWEAIRNSLGTQFAINPTTEGIKSILNLSYMHLPLHLRACFLHVGMYPEDREIERDDLVRQWVAEGFINNLYGQDMEVAAKSYFNELINRSLIQPERTDHGELLSCRVHDMMLDLILSKCAEHNFIRVECSSEDMAREHAWKYKTRRISLNLTGGSAADGTASETIASSLSQVRSLARFGESKYIPPLLHCKYIRVIHFEVLGELCHKEIDLRAISQLLQLRYLKVSADQYVKLPTEMQGLVLLETLELHIKWIQLPSDIVHLRRLTHLVVPKTDLPKGIRNMKSLRTLDGFELGWSSLEDIKGLGELTNLRCLRLSKCAMGDLNTAGVDALVSSIGMLHDLRYLCIHGQVIDTKKRLASLSDPPRHIKVFKL